MEQVLKISAIGEITLHSAQEIPLNRLQQLVGGYIEIVHPVGLVAPYVMIVDEEGLLKNKYRNALASYLYGGTIAGDAVIMAEGLNKDGENDLIGLDEQQTGTVLQYLEKLHQLIYIQRGKEKSSETAATASEQGATTGA